jgi:hypothetical protein
MTHDLVRRASRDLFRNLMKDEATVSLINRAFKAWGSTNRVPSAARKTSASAGA